MTAGPRFTNGNNIRGKQLVRQMMDEGKTFDEMVDATGLSEKTIENYQYQVRRDDEVIKPNGKPVQPPSASVKMVLRCHFTLEQSQRLIATSVRYGHVRPAMLIEQLVAMIVRDDLFQAILDVEGTP